MADYETLLYSVDERVATITLNRPESLNSLNRQLLIELDDALETAAHDDVVGAVVLTGAGRGFSSGADLAAGDADMDKHGKIDMSQVLRSRYNQIVLKIRRMPKPVIGSANGIAAGAGGAIVLGCDITVAAESASFLQAFVNIGLIPDAGGTWVVPNRIGTQRAMGMAMLGEKIPAETAKQWGLIWDVFPDEQLAEETRKIAVKLANGPALALERIKQTTYAAAKNDLSTQLELEADLQKFCGQSNDFVEGVTAFFEKRPANFTGS